MKYFCLNCDKSFERRPSRKPKYCSNKCQLNHQFITRYNLWLQGLDNPAVKQYVGFIRRALFKRDGFKCSSCKRKTWLNKPITLEVEHKDGNWMNNHSSNLCLLCPNCHSQTDTYKAKNKGNGRKYRHMATIV